MSHTKIIFIASGLSMGGAEVALIDLLSFLKEQGIHPIIICKPKSYLSKNLSGLEGVEVIEEAIPSWRKPLSRLRYPFFIRKIVWRLKGENIRLVFSNDFWTAPHALDIAKRIGCPALTFVQDSLVEERKAGLYRLQEFSRILTVSETMELRLHEILPQTKIDNVQGGIDTDRFSPEISGRDFRQELNIRPEEFVLMSVGRVCRNKGQMILIRSLVEQLRVHLDWRIVLVGPDKTPEGDEVKRFAEENSISDRVLFAGTREDMPRCLAACDVLVQLSVRESFGMAVAEGMAMAKPVIYGDIPAIVELCPDGDCGLAVESNVPKDIGEKVLYLYENPFARTEVGERGRRRILDRYSLKNKVSRVQRIIAEPVSTGWHGAPPL